MFQDFPYIIISYIIMNSKFPPHVNDSCHILHTIYISTVQCSAMVQRKHFWILTQIDPNWTFESIPLFGINIQTVVRFFFLVYTLNLRILLFLSFISLAQHIPWLPTGTLSTNNLSSIPLSSSLLVWWPIISMIPVLWQNGLQRRRP